MVQVAPFTGCWAWIMSPPLGTCSPRRIIGRPVHSIPSHVDFYLQKLRQGDYDAAFHGLIEAEPPPIPQLIQAYRSETSSDIRRELVGIIWQYRQTSVAPFLGEALSDPNPGVWKAAINGLVALACPAGLAQLRAALTTTHSTTEETNTFHKWVEEAIEQVVQGIAQDNHRTY